MKDKHWQVCNHFDLIIPTAALQANVYTSVSFVNSSTPELTPHTTTEPIATNCNMLDDCIVSLSLQFVQVQNAAMRMLLLQGADQKGR